MWIIDSLAFAIILILILMGAYTILVNLYSRMREDLYVALFVLAIAILYTAISFISFGSVDVIYLLVVMLGATFLAQLLKLRR